MHLIMPTDEREVWLDKYRPKTLDDIKGQEMNINSLKSYVGKSDIPNLLFSGPAGVGKTASVEALAHEIYGENWEENYMELNASDERGIDVIRENVKDFARTATGNANFRMIFLDEADALTDDAQAALRRTMEKYASNVVFILSCNYSSQIIGPIQSRCAIYRFNSLDDNAVREQIVEIASDQDIDITDDAVDAIIYTSNGDMRRAINTLQAVSVIDGKVTENTVYSSTNTVQPEKIEEILDLALDGKFLIARTKMKDVIQDQGVSSSELVDHFYRMIWEYEDIDDDTATDVADSLSDVDYRISQGSNPDIQLDGFLSHIASEFFTL